MSRPMRDKAYTTAVESGNTEEAQRLVDEAAEEALENSEARLTDGGEFRMGAGKLATVYHATYNDFTVFDRARLGENTDAYASDESTAATAHLGFWFNTQPLSQSASYAGGKDVKAYLNAENIYNAHSLEQLTGEIYACANRRHNSGRSYCHKRHGNASREPNLQLGHKKSPDFGRWQPGENLPVRRCLISRGN